MKRKAEAAAGELLEHAARDRLLERREQLGLGQAGGLADRCRARTPGRRPPPARAAPVVAGVSRASRWLTTSRTLSGLPSSDERRGDPDLRRRSTSTTPVSASARQSSQTRKALPAVRSWIAAASSASSGSGRSVRPGSPPTAPATSSATSASGEAGEADPRRRPRSAAGRRAARRARASSDSSR